ncbi:hypothetical protein AB1Y20_005181 [Prymnesium parvum]|uniref:Ribosomal protein mS38 C-terminal domain-containing protein n=1 Tax=Prymnesium parvum TaxID=97485 RepID=A0AB34J3E8_PRYPA
MLAARRIRMCPSIVRLRALHLPHLPPAWPAAPGASLVQRAPRWVQSDQPQPWFATDPEETRIQSHRYSLAPAGDASTWLACDVPEALNEPMQLDSTLKKRRKKMRKHRLKKRRKRDRMKRQGS